jgi:hypothetical protein
MEGLCLGEAVRGVNCRGGEDVADDDGGARGGLNAVSGAADEESCTPVPRHVQELEHRSHARCRGPSLRAPGGNAAVAHTMTVELRRGRRGREGCRRKEKKMTKTFFM